MDNAQYYRLVAQIKDLQEQIQVKNAQRESVSRELFAAEMEAYELSRLVAKKSNVDLEDGLNGQQAADKARNALKDYTAKQRNQMKEILKTADERKEEVKDLKQQLTVVQNRISGSMNSDGQIENVTKEDLQQEIAKESAKDGNSNAFSLPGNSMKDDAKAGIGGITVNNKPTKEEKDLYVQNVALSEKLTPKTTHKRIREAENKRREDFKDNQKLTDDTSDQKIKEMADGLKEIDEKILLAIGEEGYSELKDIVVYVNKSAQEGKNAKNTYPKNAIRASIKLLVSNNIVSENQTYCPFTPNFYLYYLFPLGVQVYKQKFGKAPVLSEAERMQKEHNNFEHGYGIKKAALYLKASGLYEDVIWENGRKAIDTGKKNYVPDIILTGKDGRMLYIEYERGSHSQTDFNSKCAKMASVSDTIDFIVPNEKVLQEIEGKVKKWFKSRGDGKAPTGKRVRIATARKIVKKSNLFDEESWDLVLS